jgi:hypothetical protein
MQREIECVGISTVLITVDVAQSAMARPSRAMNPKGFKIGHSVGHPFAVDLHRKVLRDALNLLLHPPEPGQIPSYEYPEYPVEEAPPVVTEVG